MTGRRLGALAASNGAELKTHLPVLWTSFTTRVALLIGTVFLMCAKPGLVGSIATLALAIGAGLLLSRRRAAPALSGSA